MAVQFARRTAHCLNTAAEIGSYTKADTLRRLMEAGYLSATGRLAVGDTIRTFVDMFGDAFACFTAFPLIGVPIRTCKYESELLDPNNGLAVLEKLELERAIWADNAPDAKK